MKALAFSYPMTINAVPNPSAVAQSWANTVTLRRLCCTGYPDSIVPVRGFELERYLGTWYEIARLDHRFERGLSQVSATYSKNADGTVQVLNRGFDPQAGEWEEAVGKARFAETPDIGFLEVSFFGPFYGSYVIFELAPDYSHAFISGPDTGYLWLLARTPTVEEEVYQRFLQLADAAGFDTQAVIRVAQD